VHGLHLHIIVDIREAIAATITGVRRQRVGVHGSKGWGSHFVPPTKVQRLPRPAAAGGESPWTAPRAGCHTVPSSQTAAKRYATPILRPPSRLRSARPVVWGWWSSLRMDGEVRMGRGGAEVGPRAGRQARATPQACQQRPPCAAHMRMQLPWSHHTGDGAYFIHRQQAQRGDRLDVGGTQEVKAWGQPPVQQPHLKAQHSVPSFRGKPSHHVQRGHNTNSTGT
jgi:hypothetical protein